MDFLIFFFLISWKYEQDMEKLRLRQAAEQAAFEHWLTEHPGGNGAGIAAAATLAAAAACCI